MTVLRAAARTAGLDASGAELIRDGSHAMYRLRGGVVARVGRKGTVGTAELEVRVSRWLSEAGVRVTEALPDLAQPVVVDERPVTWWRLLPHHRPATPAELGGLLRQLHRLPASSAPPLPAADPFTGLSERLANAQGIEASDRRWLDERLDNLREQYWDLTSGVASRVIHGDAWQGNVAVPEVGKPVLLDLEHVSIGDPDWDLVPMAVDYVDFGRLSAEDYASFMEAYGGRDVVETSGFRVLAEVQEIRWVCFVVDKAAVSRSARREARHRIACLRGAIPRPWTWKAF